MIRIPLMKTFLILNHSHYFSAQLSRFITRWIIGTRSINNNDEAKVSSILSMLKQTELTAINCRRTLQSIILIKAVITRKNFLISLRMDKQTVI